ncbi:uncharacterized protein [Maniola hyperantus]|uniref:uncharacterized protein isoform X2 n=1 Tax=Aphantopus hyperantus TaxID=2795564 RepID=UPI003748ADEA
MEFDEEKLINLVSAYQELYDLQHEHYMNQLRKSNIWAEIAIEMGVSAKICKERWKSLRDSYNRSLKRQKTKSGDGVSSLKRWRFEEQMAFLRPFFSERKVISNLETVEDASNVDNDVFTISSTPPLTASTMFADMRRRKTKRVIPRKSEVATLLQKYIDSRENQSPNTNNNPIHSFFAAMANTVITFPPDIQLKIKNQLYLAVSQAEFDLQQSVNAAEGRIQLIQQDLQYNIPRPENQYLSTESESPTPTPTQARTRFLSSESELEYTDVLAQTQSENPPPSNSIKTECDVSARSNVDLAETSRPTNSKQYSITPDGTLVIYDNL